MYQIIKADIIEWLKEYQGEPFHAMLFDPPYHLTSITERFGKEDSKSAKEGVYKRSSSGFMGKNWDGGDLIFQSETWQLLSTVLYSGAFIMAYCSSRGWHRQAVAMEDGGFIFHPSIFMFGMAFGSGFPKATRIDTQIDVMAGEEREVVDSDSKVGITKLEDGKTTFNNYEGKWNITKPATPLAETWQGHRYGLQCIKPSLEPILVGQLPYQGKPVENITKTGAGAINVEGGRIGTEDDLSRVSPGIKSIHRKGIEMGYRKQSSYLEHESRLFDRSNISGRWPANLILHHLPECKQIGTKRVKGNGQPSKSNDNTTSDEIYGQYDNRSAEYHADSDGYETITEWQCVENCPIKQLDERSVINPPKNTKSIQTEKSNYNASSYKAGTHKFVRTFYPDSNSGAARYFHQSNFSYEIYEQLNNADLLQYITKPSTTEREAGLEKLPSGIRNRVNSGGYEADPKFAPVERKNTHPTVKSIALNKYLATLLLPPAEYAPRRILVPFAGSGSEMIGCLLAGWDEVIGIELEQEYYDIANERVAWWYKVMESCNYEVDNIIKLWQEEQRIKESGQMRLL